MLTRPLTVSGSATLQNSITDVFAVLSDPVRVAAMTPKVALIGKVEELSTGGFRYRAASRWHGLHYRVTVVTDHFDPPRAIAFSFGEIEPGLPARLLRLRVSDRVKYTLAPESGDSTCVTVVVTWPSLSVFTVWLFSLFRRRMMDAHFRRLQELVGERP